MLKLIKKKPLTPVTLREHFLRRNKIAIKRRGGGHGDILVQRMLFEDIKNLDPNIESTFTCPRHYIEFAENHPYCKAVSLDDFIDREYGAIYDITTCCRVHECKNGSTNDKNRSDIWAEFCGIKLQNHNMHLVCDPKIEKYNKERIASFNPQGMPTVLLQPYSTTCEFGTAKSLTEQQIIETTMTLKSLGYFLYTTGDQEKNLLKELNVFQFIREKPFDWIGLTAAADYVISVDTATFHLAAGLKKPLVGIFSFTDGKLYGKYYDFILVQKHRDNGDWDCGPCYLMSNCPKSKDKQKPCITELNTESIIDGFYQATQRWPVSSH